MAKPVTVFVVVECEDQGKVAGVFSTMEAAVRYTNKHTYSAFMITEHIVDSADSTT